MTEANDSSKNSLSPVETAPAGLDDEAVNLNKGNGLRLAGFAAGAAGLVAVLVAVLGNLDNRQAYVDAGARVAVLHENGFEAFWNCVLINMNQAQIKSAEDLAFQLDKRAAHFGHAYAAQIGKCGPSLDAFERDLATISVPETLRPQVKAMEQAAGAERHALQDLVALMDARKQQPYDADAMRPALTKLASGWQSYQTSHTAFTDALRGHIN